MEKIKLNDKVYVLTGKDKGKTGKVLKISRSRNRALVEGINMVKKTIKATQENQAGGIESKESFIHLSNVALVSPKTNGPTRVRIKVEGKKKVRVSVKCGSVLD